MKSRRLLSLKEAEAMTGRKASTWRRDILLRRIPYVKLVRQVRIPIEVIEDLIARGYRPAIPFEGKKQPGPTQIDG